MHKKAQAIFKKQYFAETIFTSYIKIKMKSKIINFLNKQNC